MRSTAARKKNNIQLILETGLILEVTPPLQPLTLFYYFFNIELGIP